MTGTNERQSIFKRRAAVIALATVLVSLYAIPSLQDQGLEALGFFVGGALALACVGALYELVRDRRTH